MPLIERVKFLAIFASNLDEFFMVRVAGVHDQIDARIDARGADGLSPTKRSRRSRDGAERRTPATPAVQRDVISPALAEHGIRIVSCEESGASAQELARHFREHIFPVLTPLAIGPGARSPTSPTCR